MAATEDTESSQKPCRFFLIPRELRDRIYEEMKCTVPLSRKHNEMHTMRGSVRAIDPSLRIVSRRFRHEVDHITSQTNSKLEIESDYELSRILL